MARFTLRRRCKIHPSNVDLPKLHRSQAASHSNFLQSYVLHSVSRNYQMVLVHEYRMSCLVKSSGLDLVQLQARRNLAVISCGPANMTALAAPNLQAEEQKQQGDQKLLTNTKEQVVAQPDSPR